MSDRTLARRPRRLLSATLAIGLALLLAACTSATDTLRSALDEAVAATASSALAVDLNDAGKALPPLTDTVLSDALAELQKAETSVAELKPSPSQSHDRADVLTAIQSAMDAVLTAREAVASGGDLDGPADDLDSAGDALKALAKDLS